MNKKARLERDTMAAADALLRGGKKRVVYIFAAEDDGESPHGVNYCIHGEGDGESSLLLKQSVAVMTAVNRKVWERFTAGEKGE